MKKLFIMFICLTIVVCLCTCCNNKESANNDVSEKSSSDELQEGIADIHYSDVTGYILDATWINQSVKNIEFPEENLFIESERMLGYDYMSFGGIKGSISVYLNDDSITSLVLGSKPYEEKSTFAEAFSTANKAVAEVAGQGVTEPKFSGNELNNEKDRIESVLEGEGVMLSEYKLTNITVSVKACGVNGAANIMIEFAPNK